MPTPKEIEITIADLRRNSEAAMALVMIANVDQWLESLIVRKMRTLSKTVTERIFASFGPLYELAAKIDVAYAFDLIDDEALADLRVLKDIRNAFAHATQNTHFESENIEKLCKKISGVKPKAKSRDVFLYAVARNVMVITKRCAEMDEAKALAAALSGASRGKSPPPRHSRRRSSD